MEKLVYKVSKFRFFVVLFSLCNFFRCISCCPDVLVSGFLILDGPVYFVFIGHGLVPWGAVAGLFVEALAGICTLTLPLTDFSVGESVEATGCVIGGNFSLCVLHVIYLSIVWLV